MNKADKAYFKKRLKQARKAWEKAKEGKDNLAERRYYGEWIVFKGIVDGINSGYFDLIKTLNDFKKS